MKELQKPSHNGRDWSVMIDDDEVVLAPGQTYAGITFELVDFEALNLFGCTFDKCTFVECSFTNSDFSHGTFSSCTWTDCSLVGSVFYWVSLKSCRFAGVNLLTARWTDVEAVCTTITESNLTGMNLHSVNFAGCMLTRSNVDGTEFKDCIFVECIWSHLATKSRRLRLIGSHLEKVELNRVEAHRAQIYGTTFEKCRLIACNFWKGKMAFVKLLRTDFLHCGLNECRLVQVVVVNGSFHACRLRLVKWAYSTLETTSLTANSMEGSVFESILFYETGTAGNFLGEGTDHPAILS